MSASPRLSVGALVTASSLEVRGHSSLDQEALSLSRGRPQESKAGVKSDLLL